MRLAYILALATILCAGGVQAETITYPSLGTGKPIKAELFEPGSAGPHPAVVLFHGCGGLWNRRGQLSARQAEMARHLVRIGYVVLIPDSFRSRGEEEVCSQPLRERPVTHDDRRGDALGALAWLRARPDVDAGRIAAIGWSHGGSVVLNATNRLSQTVSASGLAFKAAIAFYPGCVDGRGAGRYAPTAPVLILMGASDDWTRPEPCQRLAAAMAEEREPLTLVLYPGAYHGFDSPADFSNTMRVQGGTRTVTMASNPAARADAAQQVDRFLAEQLGR